MFDVQQRLELVGHACAGMGALHRAGVAHLDMKPENLLVFSEGGRPVLKVADLGLARPMDPATGLCHSGGRFQCAPAPQLCTCWSMGGPHVCPLFNDDMRQGPVSAMIIGLYRLIWSEMPLLCSLPQGSREPNNGLP